MKTPNLIGAIPTEGNRLLPSGVYMDFWEKGEKWKKYIVKVLRNVHLLKDSPFPLIKFEYWYTNHGLVGAMDVLMCL